MASIQIDIQTFVQELKSLLDANPLMKFETGLEEILNKNLSGIRLDVRLACADRIRQLTIEWRFERMRRQRKHRVSRHSVGKILSRRDFPLSGKDRAAGEKDVA